MPGSHRRGLRIRTRALKCFAPSPGDAPRPEAERPSLERADHTGPPRAPGDVADPCVDRHGCRAVAAAQPRPCEHVLEVELPQLAQVHGAQDAVVVPPAALERAVARSESGGMSSRERRLSTRTTSRLMPPRRAGAELEGEVGADVRPERGAVEPDLRAVVHRLEAKEPARPSAGARQPEVLAVPVDRSRVAGDGEVAGVQGGGDGDRAPARKALAGLKALLDAAQRRVGTRVPVAVEQVAAGGPVAPDRLGLGSRGRERRRGEGRGEQDAERNGDAGGEGHDAGT